MPNFPNLGLTPGRRPSLMTPPTGIPNNTGAGALMTPPAGMNLPTGGAPAMQGGFPGVPLPQMMAPPAPNLQAAGPSPIGGNPLAGMGDVPLPGRGLDQLQTMNADPSLGQMDLPNSARTAPGPDVGKAPSGYQAALATGMKALAGAAKAAQGQQRSLTPAKFDFSPMQIPQSQAVAGNPNAGASLQALIQQMQQRR